ncbi:hypothetical protein EIK77_000486 [Talaromyces pinophilus]|nr:hypothetical protein EIK77_000486 [Talaromyces pinophilus]
MVRESLARDVDPLNVTETAQMCKFETMLFETYLGEVPHYPTGASPQIGFINEADQDTANNILESIINAIGNYTRAQDTYLEFTFLNDAHFRQNPLADYGEGKYANLQTVARKYDPNGVFQKIASRQIQAI